jgi:thiol-disulfide isomerase/thioredoxin
VTPEKPDRINEKVAAYYAEKMPPAASVERLVSLACGARATAPSVGGSPGRAADARFGAVALVAASFLLAVPSFYLGFRTGRARADGTSAPRSKAHPAPAVSPSAAPVADAAPAVNSADAPRFVLVRIHADWCPRCPSIAPIFEELTGKYAKEPLLMVTLDITSPETRLQTRYLAKSLGVYEQIGIDYDAQGRAKLEPGMIRLIDREQHEIVATLRSVDERPVFEDALVHALPAGVPPTP